jgi:hypothetical protein
MTESSCVLKVYDSGEVFSARLEGGKRRREKRDKSQIFIVSGDEIVLWFFIVL